MSGARARGSILLGAVTAGTWAGGAAATVVATVPRGQDLAGIAVDGPYLAVAQDGVLARPGSRVRVVSLRGGRTLLTVYRESRCSDPTVWDVAVAGPRVAWNTTSTCQTGDLDEQRISTVGGQIVDTAPGTPIGRLAGGDSTLVVQVGEAIQLAAAGRRRTVAVTRVLTPIGLDRGRILTWNIATGGLRLYALSGRVLADIPGARADHAAVDGNSIVAIRQGAARLDWYTTAGLRRRTFAVRGDNDGRVDVQGRYVVYTAGRRQVRVLNLGTREDRVTQRAPVGGRIVDAEIDGSNIVYGVRFGAEDAGGGGRVSAVPIPGF